MMTDRQDNESDALQPAELDDIAIESIHRLEEQLGDGICLLAVKKQPLFILEAKVAPNNWRSVRDVYPQAELTPYYRDKEESKLAKATLKSLLLSKWKKRFKKYPIRIRQIG